MEELDRATFVQVPLRPPVVVSVKAVVEALSSRREHDTAQSSAPVWLSSAAKKTVLLTRLNSVGLDERAPEAIFCTRLVPGVVPSVCHTSVPIVLSVAANRAYCPYPNLADMLGAGVCEPQRQLADEGLLRFGNTVLSVLPRD